MRGGGHWSIGGLGACPKLPYKLIKLILLKKKICCAGSANNPMRFWQWYKWSKKQNSLAIFIYWQQVMSEQRGQQEIYSFKATTATLGGLMKYATSETKHSSSIIYRNIGFWFYWLNKIAVSTFPIKGEVRVACLPVWRQEQILWWCF